MLSRINVHAKGMSGCRLIITKTLVDMLNKGVTPQVCTKGSVGACGDLAPMSQIALVLLGEGKAYYKDELLDGKEALQKAGIDIPGLEARDGLAVINGSNLLTSMSALFINDTINWVKHAEIAAAMSYDALLANPGPLNHLIHKVRGFSGAIKSACSLRNNLKDEVKESSLHNKEGKKVGEVLSREGKYGFIFFKNKDDQNDSVYLDGQILNIL